MTDNDRMAGIALARLVDETAAGIAAGNPGASRTATETFVAGATDDALRTAWVIWGMNPVRFFRAGVLRMVTRRFDVAERVRMGAEFV